jgi:tape measure domain-containing protein
MSNFSEVGIRAVMDLGNMVSNSQSYIDKINDMNKATANFALNATKNFSLASKGVSDFEKFVDKVKTVASGILISDIIRGIANGISDATSEMFNAVSQFQTIKIQMDTLAAREFSEQFGVTIPEALEKTSGEAEQLLRWVRELAVTTPFSVENLASVTALSNAYGFTIPKVKELVVAVGNFTAGMGLSDDVLKRIIYNMGQMVAQGKPTGRELRDLSNSFVPIGEMQERFAKQLGTSKAAIVDMMKTGEISARQFVDEFIEMVDEDFPGAMERMSRTFTAAFNNVKDLVQSMLGYEILGPVATEVAGALQDAVSGFLTDENYQKASMAGQSLLFVYQRMAETLTGALNPAVQRFFSLFDTGDSLSNRFVTSLMTMTAWVQNLGEAMSSGINFASDFISGIYTKFETSFSDLTTKMNTWGQNLVLSFAKGMSSAIIAVLNVISAIGRTISHWLKSNSPPLLLPELTTWGTNAMMSYLEGWTKADFSVFEDIGDVISNMINSWSGQLSDQQINSNLISSTVALSQLIEQYRTLGTVSSESISKLVSATGIASNELSRYVQTSFNLMDMQKISNAVSKTLDFSGKGSIDIFGISVSSFEEIANMADKFGPSLANYIRQYSQDASKLLILDKQLTSAQNELNEVSAKYTSILAGLEAQLNVVTDRQEDITRIKVIDTTLSKVILTDEERERLNLEKKKLLLDREIRNTKTQKETEESRLEAVISGYETEKKALQDRADEERKLIKQISDDNIASLEGQLEAIKQIINAQTKLNELYAKTKEKKSAGAGLDTEDITDSIQAAMEGALTSATDAIDPTKFLDDLWTKIKSKVDAQAQEIRDVFSPVSKVFDDVVSEWTGIFSSKEFKTSWDGFTSRLDKGFSILKGFWNEDGEGILKSLGGLLGTIVTNLVITSDKTGKSVLQILADSFVTIAQTVAAHGGDIQKILDKISEFMNNKAFPAFKEALTIIGNEVIPALINFAVVAIPPLMDLFGYLVTNWKTVLMVALAFQMMGGITSAGKSILGSGAKGIGFVLGGITLLKALGIGGVAGAAGAGSAGSLGIEELLASWGIGTGAKAATGATGTTGVTGILGKILPWLTALQMTMGLKGGEPTEDWKTGYESKYDVELGTMTSDEVASQQRAKLDKWVADQFGENSAFQISIKNNWNTLFGSEGTFATLLDTLFGEGSFADKIGTWASNTFGEKSLFHTNADKNWKLVFGEEGILVTSFDFLFGEEGILSKDSVVSWIDRNFGEKSLFQTNIDELWSMVFGEEGILVTGYNFLFGEEGYLKSDPIGKWLEDTFGEGSLFVETMTKLWNDVFGEDGLLENIYNFLFNPETTFFSKDLAINAGGSIVDGVKTGIVNQKPSLIETVKQMAQEVLDAFNIHLNINSPAKKFITSGKAIDEGIARGIIAEIPLVKSAMRSLMTSSIPSQSVTNDNRVFIDMKPSYSTVQSPSTLYHDTLAAISSVRM